jgi:hypothetical protein
MGETISQSSSALPPHPPQDALSDSSICLLWRCLSCNATQLGQLDHPPARCAYCGGDRFESDAED